MPADLLPDGTLDLLAKTLDWRSQGHKSITGNLANLDTPHYRRREVNFQQVLNQHLTGGPAIRLATTNPRHLPGSPAPAGLIRDTSESVDLDQEMVQLTLNQLGYQASATMLNKKLDELRAVIEGDKR